MGCGRPRRVGCDRHGARVEAKQHELVVGTVRNDVLARAVSDQDVSRVRTIKTLIGYGYSVSELSKLDDDRLRIKLDSHRTGSVHESGTITTPRSIMARAR